MCGEVDWCIGESNKDIALGEPHRFVLTQLLESDRKASGAILRKFDGEYRGVVPHRRVVAQTLHGVGRSVLEQMLPRFMDLARWLRQGRHGHVAFNCTHISGAGVQHGPVVHDDIRFQTHASHCRYSDAR